MRQSPSRLSLCACVHARLIAHRVTPRCDHAILWIIVESKVDVIYLLFILLVWFELILVFLFLPGNSTPHLVRLVAELVLQFVSGLRVGRPTEGGARGDSLPASLNGHRRMPLGV